MHAHANKATLQSHSRSNKNEVGAVAFFVYGTPSCVSSKWGLDASGVILTRPSAPPVGLGRRFSRPQKTRGAQGFGREAMLTWLGRSEHPAPQHTTPSASSGPWWPYCAVAPLASPAAHRRMGRGHIWKQCHPPPSAPIHSLGSSLPGGFLTPLAILSWCLMIPGLRSGARPPQGSDADRSHVARRARDSAGAPRVALWGGGLARWGAPGKAGAGRARRRRGQGRRGRRRAARGEPARRLGLPRPGPPTRSSGAGAGADSGRPPLFAFLWQAAGLGLKGIASIWNVVYFS